MVILSKRKIIYIIGIISMYILTYVVIGYNITSSENNNSNILTIK